MAEIIERVARAIFEEEYADPRRLRPDCEPQWKLFERHARAAIKALREPTEEMIDHALLNTSHTIESVSDYPAADDQVRAFWQAMIDEAMRG